ncbi:amino acid adenylation domain-containing protein [Micromonospora sp. NPDC049101]|uniref:amino acid adenylation domain-containing protein n=1 Tax=Micromonospora sp. NPDC049101 TaxID=3155032 RepID=UPI0033FCD668
MSQHDGEAAASDDLLDHFHRTARRLPESPAISDNGRVLSYAQLERLVRETAAEIGPQPGVVGVRTARSADTIVRLLGVLDAGGTYCPIDPTFPVSRQQELVTASGSARILPAAPEPSTSGSSVDGPTDPFADSVHEAVGDPATFGAPDPDDPAYVLFTSGSTGTPKAVLTPRRAITAATRSLAELFDIGPGDRVLQFASLNWDTCFEEILPTLTSGATLVFNSEAYSGSFPRFLRMVAAEGVTVLDLPTAFWHELVHYLVEDEATLPACVRLMIIGGEAASPARLADWCARDTAAIRLVNTYGCTETTLVTHAVDLYGPRTPGAGSGWDPTRRVPIGRVLPHVREHISDEGELLIGGASVALGYLGLAAETAARFELLDLGDGPQRYFHTGDRVSRAVDGTLIHEGRLDSQIKVRGFRVDPGEVEAQISGHPDVAATAVAGVTVANHTTMTAYVVPRPRADTEVLGAEVLAYLRTRVPRHLVPNRIIVVPGLVYTSSGKVDRAGSHRRYGSDHVSRS